MLKVLDDSDNVFLIMFMLFGVMMLLVWSIKYILLCYLTDNVWWGNSFEWLGVVLNWVGS